MYNEEAKIIYCNFYITYRYFRFFAMSSYFLHRGERMKSCFADSYPTVGSADRSLQNNIRLWNLVPKAFLLRFGRPRHQTKVAVHMAEIL